jgi:hypothetical protein
MENENDEAERQPRLKRFLDKIKRNAVKEKDVENFRKEIIGIYEKYDTAGVFIVPSEFGMNVLGSRLTEEECFETLKGVGAMMMASKGGEC